MIGAPDLPRVGIFVAAALLLLVTPGPAVLYIVTRSVDQGRRVGLICLGVHRILDHPATLVTGPRAERAWRRAFLDRVVVNVLNPKTALFFLAFLPQFVDVSRSGVGMQVLALGALFVTLGLITDGCYVLTAGTIARWLRGHARIQARGRWISGGMYVGLGLATALSSGHRK